MVIDYYSDVLCVWAWITQRRIDELNLKFGDAIKWRFHYMDVFGDVDSKMQTQWSERGGYEGFAQHVASSAANFEGVKVSPKLWTQTRPKTSANAHLLLQAVALAHGVAASHDFALTLRKAFFVEAQDIAELSVLFDLLAKSGLAEEPVRQMINSGQAMATLMGDYQKAKSLNIKGSPSFVLDGGRQVLYGNVGYRVLHANIDELLKHPTDEASWC